VLSEPEKKTGWLYSHPGDCPEILVHQATGEGEEELDKKGFYSLFAELQAVDFCAWVSPTGRAGHRIPQKSGLLRIFRTLPYSHAFDHGDEYQKNVGLNFSTSIKKPFSNLSFYLLCSSIPHFHHHFQSSCSSFNHHFHHATIHGGGKTPQDLPSSVSESAFRMFDADGSGKLHLGVEDHHLGCICTPCK